MKTKALKISDLSLSFYSIDTIKIFEHLDLEIFDCEKIGIKAPSGSGKTTLFRLIMKYILPDSGTIICNLNKSLMSQTPMLNPYLTVNEIVNIELINNQKKVEAEELLIQIGLDQFKNHLFSNLSGGQKQRVVLLTKILSNCKLLLADEPFNALEKKLSKETRNIFLDEVEKSKMTCIVTSHNPLHLERMDRIFTIENYKLMEI